MTVIEREVIEGGARPEGGLDRQGGDVEIQGGEVGAHRGDVGDTIPEAVHDVREDRDLRREGLRGRRSRGHRKSHRLEIRLDIRPEIRHRWLRWRAHPADRQCWRVYGRPADGPDLHGAVGA